MNPYVYRYHGPSRVQILKAKALSSQKWPADFSTKDIRVTRENRGKAAKTRRTKAARWHYETVNGYRLLGDEGRTAGISKKTELTDDDVFCVRQHDRSPSDEAVMDREKQERAREEHAARQARKNAAEKKRKDQGGSGALEGQGKATTVENNAATVDDPAKSGFISMLQAAAQTERQTGWHLWIHGL